MPKKRDEKKNEGCKVNIVKESNSLIINQIRTFKMHYSDTFFLMRYFMKYKSREIFI